MHSMVDQPLYLQISRWSIATINQVVHDQALWTMGDFSRLLAKMVAGDDSTRFGEAHGMMKMVVVLGYGNSIVHESP